MRGHAEGFGGMTAKIDEPTGVNWNDATVNEGERVGISDRTLACFFECRTVPLSFVLYESHGEAISENGE